MSLTRKLSLTALVLALGTGVAACNKQQEPAPAEPLGENAGNAQQRIEQGWDEAKKSTSDVLNNAADRLESSGESGAQGTPPDAGQGTGPKP